MTTTEIAPSATAELQRLIESGKINLSELMERLARPAAEGTEKPKPKAVVLSAADKKALRTLPAQLADLDLPTHARKLSESEREHLVPLFTQVKSALAAVEKAEKALKEAMHGHIDASSPADAPRDKNGHKLTEGEVVAPSFAQKVVRGLVGGKGVELSDADLKAMEEEGLITHAQYLRMTKTLPAVRVPVADAIMAEIQKAPELLVAFAAKARKTDQTTAIRLAKN